MTFFAPRIERITHSSRNSLTRRMRELHTQGCDFIGLTLGEPDFDTLDNIKRAAESVIARNEHLLTLLVHTGWEQA